MPFLSIITPLYNKELYIAETIKSVLQQSYTDWEMIVVENGSTDQGPYIVREIQDPRVRLVVSEKKGPSVARNLGIQESKGEWIQFLDGDDLLLPGHLQAMHEATVAHPDATLVSCDWLQGPEFDPPSNARKYPTNRNERTDYASSAIAYTPWVPHAAWVKRCLLGEPPWWDEDFDQLLAEDHIFWFKMLLSAKAAYSDHLGVFYRIDAKDRRHNLSDYDRFLKIMGLTFAANIDLLKGAGRSLNYNHRRTLMTCYLQQSIADLRDTDLRRQILQKVREFRPSFADAVRKKDLVVLMSYVMPLRALARLQERNRTRANRREQLH
jgi:glycosyltransferase involved in cell wall biosynthesis